MSMMEVHAEALEVANAAYHEFLMYYRNDARLVYGFVEGREDPTFYRGIIDLVLDEEWSVKLIAGGNRSRVIELARQMDWDRFSQRRVCFFIDRDLSDYLGEQLPSDQNIYVTDGYSIENSIVCHYTLERVLEEIFGFNGISPAESDRIREKFQASIETFTEAMIPVMAQVLLWMRGEAAPCLDNLRLKEWFSFRDGKVTLRRDYRSNRRRMISAANWCSCQALKNEDVVHAAGELLRSRSGAEVIRGKYMLWFFLETLRSCHEGAGQLCAKFKHRRPKEKVAIGMGNAMALFGNRVRVPASLRKFIQKNYCAYIEGLTS